MNDDGDAIRVLLGGDPRAIHAAGLRGVDADAAFSPQLISQLEALGFKRPGRPMTVTELARALVEGVIPPDTQIIKRLG